MKLCLPLLASVLALASCSTAYKTGQTPDDVYFSPARQRDEYVRTEKKDDQQYQNRYQDETLEDRYLRMKVYDRRYAFLDNDAEFYLYTQNFNRYFNYYQLNNFTYGNCWVNNNYAPKYHGYLNNYYDPYYYNPYYGNPYYHGVVYGNVSPVYNKPRGTNLNTYYNNTNNGTSNYSKGGNYNSVNSNPGNYHNSGTNAGGFLRNVFGSGSNTSSSSSNSSTSSTPSSSSSSSSGNSSSGSSSSAPVRKF